MNPKNFANTSTSLNSYIPNYQEKLSLDFKSESNNNFNYINSGNQENLGNKVLSKTLEKNTQNLNSTFTSTNDNLKVIIRVRPALPREMEDNLPFRSVVLITNENKSCNLVLLYIP